MKVLNDTMCKKISFKKLALNLNIPITKLIDHIGKTKFDWNPELRISDTGKVVDGVLSLKNIAELKQQFPELFISTGIKNV